jgi:hypothetical protein
LLNSGSKSGALVFYATGLPPSVGCIKFEIVINFEATVKPANYDYIPNSLYRGGYEDQAVAKKYMASNNTTLREDNDAMNPYVKMLNPAALKDSDIDLDARLNIPVDRETSSNVMGVLGDMLTAIVPYVGPIVSSFF